jgi:hypothetical protein
VKHGTEAKREKKKEKGKNKKGVRAISDLILHHAPLYKKENIAMISMK